MNHNHSIMAGGHAGEKIVMYYLAQDRDLIIRESLSPFDSEKDFTIENILFGDGILKTAEVKTQVPYILKKAFTFRENQFRKCMNVDYLFFVGTPPMRNDPPKWCGKIFICRPKDRPPQVFQYEAQGRRMYGISIDQAAIQCWKSMTKEEIETLQKYSVSDY